MPQPPPPAYRHRNRIKQRSKKTEVANPDLELLEPRRAQRLDDERNYVCIILLAVCPGKGFDARLAKLRGVCAPSAPRLIAKGKTVVAIARWNSTGRVARQMKSTSRHGEVRAQAQLLTVRVGKHICARAQGLSDNVKEKSGWLDDGRRDRFIAGTCEGGHQTLCLGFERFYLFSGFCGHGHRY